MKVEKVAMTLRTRTENAEERNPSVNKPMETKNSMINGKLITNSVLFPQLYPVNQTKTKTYTKGQAKGLVYVGPQTQSTAVTWYKQFLLTG